MPGYDWQNTYSGGKSQRGSDQTVDRSGRHDSGQNYRSGQNDQKLLSQLKNISAQGKGNTAQARYLESVLSPNQLKNYRDSQIAQYQQEKLDKVPSSTLPEGQWLDIGGKKVWSASPFKPGQFAGNQYEGAQPYLQSQLKGARDKEGRLINNLGLESIMQATPYMDFGFGSVFGASSPTAASSKAVQESLETMMDQLYDQGYTPDAAREIAFQKMYPKMDQLTEEEFAIKYPEAYERGDYTAAMATTAPGYGNLMSKRGWRDLKGEEIEEDWGGHPTVASTWQPQNRYVGYDYDGSGGYGDYDGGGGFSRGSDLPETGYPTFMEPRWGQSQIQQQFIDQQTGFATRNRGGLVSLLGDY